MERPQLCLGDYDQLLLKHGLLASAAPLGADLAQTVTAVTCDSRSAVPGSLFICKGAAFRQAYLEQALKQGAVAYVSEQIYDVPAPCIRVTDIRQAMGLLADRAWGHPSGRLQITGITGTKGKTTTAFYLTSILNCWREAEGKHPVGLLSTIVTDDGAQRRPAVLTTPEPLDLQRHLWNAVNSGCDYLVMEESSQALKYGRVIGVDLAAAVFLNLGEDHISPTEHPDREDYFRSKLKIFGQAKAAVVNLDDPSSDRTLAAARHCPTVLTYSLENPSADVYGRELAREGEGLGFTARWNGPEQRLWIPMTGAFNVSNALAALAVCRLLEVPACYTAEGLARAKVPGRMETYHQGGRHVVVDFAHNGLSLEALLASVKEDYPGLPVTLMFGCTGEKGLDRRPGMAKAAARYADRIILTEDDPGKVPVEEVCADIGRHLAEHGRTWEVIPVRADAIREAIGSCPVPGVVVLAGKGDEGSQIRTDGPEPGVPDGLWARKFLGLPLTEDEIRNPFRDRGV